MAISGLLHVSVNIYPVSAGSMATVAQRPADCCFDELLERLGFALMGCVSVVCSHHDDFRLHCSPVASRWVIGLLFGRAVVALVLLVASFLQVL